MKFYLKLKSPIIEMALFEFFSYLFPSDKSDGN